MGENRGERNEEGGIWKASADIQEASGGASGGIWEASGGIWEASGGIWEAPRASGRDLEASGDVSEASKGIWKHLGGIWEASRRYVKASGRHLGASERQLHHKNSKTRSIF